MSHSPKRWSIKGAVFAASLSVVFAACGGAGGFRQQQEARRVRLADRRFQNLLEIRGHSLRRLAIDNIAVVIQISAEASANFGQLQNNLGLPFLLRDDHPRSQR